MKWLLRIFLAVLLLICVVLPAAAWLSFPWYAPSLLDRLLQGKPFIISVSDIALPSTSGIRFRSLRAAFTPPPDGCSDEATTYSLSLSNGWISWQFNNQEPQKLPGEVPPLFHAAITLQADSLRVLTNPNQFTVFDRNPRITLNLNISRSKGLALSIQPLSAAYRVEDGAVSREKLRLEGVNYQIRLDAAEKWQQPLDTLRVEKLYSDGNPSPVGKFMALFGSKRDPLKPCTLTLKRCSVELFGWKGSAREIEYDLKNKRTRFSLNLAEIPLAELPGFRSEGSKRPFASGRISGSIPIEFQDSTVLVRNAVVVATKGSGIIYYTSDDKPWLSLDLGPRKGEGELLKNINATVKLNSPEKLLSGLAVSKLTASLFGGKITATPFIFEPSSNTTLLTLKLSNIKALERVRLHGDFNGSLRGPVSGTVPIAMTKKGFSIQNALLQSSGGGTITIAPPTKQQSTSERIFGPEKPDADYTFQQPDLVLNRSFNGSATIRFKLKQVLRKTAGGEMVLIAPKGTLSLWQNPRNPNIISLSEFSAGLLDGSVSLKQVNYDMTKKEAETTLLFDNIPLQKLLDLQGSKKIFATGTVRGSLPVRIKGGLFEIMKGDMTAEQSGQIIYATTPEERAAANQGMRTTYEALSNFLYVHLVSSINMAPDGKSVISIQLKGTNPDFQAGRAIELNLSVDQNLLELLRTLSISSNIEQIITEKALQIQKKK